MSTLSDELSTVATELITEFGEAIVFNRIDSGTYDPTTGQGTTDISQSYSGYGVPFEYSSREIDNTTVLRGDKYLLCHEMSSVPTVNDEVLLSGVSYRVLRVSHTRLNGADVIYKVQIRI